MNARPLSLAPSVGYTPRQFNGQPTAAVVIGEDGSRPLAPALQAGAFLPVNWSGIPLELHNLPRFTLWQAIAQSDGAKPRKLPQRCDGRGPAKCNDSRTWASFGDCWFAYRALKPSGILFALDGEISVIDLDHSRDARTGEIDPWARELIGNVQSFTEVSPSGTGLHIWVRGQVPKGLNGRIEGHPIELYSTGRFMSLTGWQVLV